MEKSLAAYSPSDKIVLESRIRELRKLLRALQRRIEELEAASFRVSEDEEVVAITSPEDQG